MFGPTIGTGTRWLVGIKHGDIAAIGSVVTAGVPRFPGACHQIKDRAGRPRRLFTQGHYHGVVTISLSGHEHDLTASAPPREIASKGGLTDTCIRTVSLRTGVSVSGKRNFVRRDKGNETSREVHREPRQRRSSRHKSADSAAITAWPGNLFGSRNARWRTQSPSNLSPRKSFPGIREKYREKIGGVTNPASIGGAVHALKSSTLDEIAEQKCSEEQGISDRITGKQILKTGKLFVLL